MTKYKVVQNIGISLTKGADVTLEVFYMEMYKNQYTVIDGSLQSYLYKWYVLSPPETQMEEASNRGGLSADKNRDVCMH